MVISGEMIENTIKGSKLDVREKKKHYKKERMRDPSNLFRESAKHRICHVPYLSQRDTQTFEPKLPKPKTLFTPQPTANQYNPLAYYHLTLNLGYPNFLLHWLKPLSQYTQKLTCINPLDCHPLAHKVIRLHQPSFLFLLATSPLFN